jgi:serine protease inhibitor
MFQSSEKSIRLPMMTTTQQLAYLDKWKYTAISLPLDENSNAGNFIIVLPKEKSR